MAKISKNSSPQPQPPCLTACPSKPHKFRDDRVERDHREQQCRSVDDPTKAPHPRVAAHPDPPAPTPITITAGDRVFTATLKYSHAGFRRPLPLTQPASRVGSIEFVLELAAAPLTETGPLYRTVAAGEIVYLNLRDSVTVIYEPTSPVDELTMNPPRRVRRLYDDRNCATSLITKARSRIRSSFTGGMPQQYLYKRRLLTQSRYAAISASK